MNKALDTAGVRTWPVIGTGTVAVTPLPSDDGATAGRELVEGKREAGAGDSMAGATAASPVDTRSTTATVAQPASFAEPPSGAGMVGTTIVTLVLVIGFILLLAWLAKRMPGLGGAGNPALRIVGSLPLGPRERVVVVAVGDTQLLLATGPNGTRALHTLEQPLPVAAPAASPFAQVLAQQFGRKKP